MPYRGMSLEDFAKHVGMDVREVCRLADRGTLPGQKVGGQWRFNRARVTEWLQQEMTNFDEDRLIGLERAMGAAASEMTVTEMIGLEGVDVTLAANTRASVLRELVNLAQRTGLLYDDKSLLKALEEREAMCSTALPGGVAIPHPRQPMPYVSAEPFLCVYRLSRGIGFGSPYRDLTRLFFLICCHDDRHHLRVLARLVRILDQGMIDQIMAVETREELLQMMIDKEKRIVAEARD